MSSNKGFAGRFGAGFRGFAPGLGRFGSEKVAKRFFLPKGVLLILVFKLYFGE
jgi:hypothetical protein